MSASLNLDPAAFLAQYWQREHLYLAGGITGFSPPADADELAGLAMEPEADSRIVYLQDRLWRQRQGPFNAADFARKGAWSLLVQGVDHHWDEAAALLKLVDWLPSWRFDDVLMSYASDGGSAAPHFDRYDVFIIQGEGQRRWQVGDFCDAHTPLASGGDVSTLERFTARNEYLLQTGDVLYLPPGCAHYGVSIGESTSFSIGFRAPRVNDLLARCVDNLLESIDPERLLADPGRQVSQGSGEISASDVQEARLQLIALLQESDGHWLGEVVTARGDADRPQRADAQTIEAIVDANPKASTLLGKAPGGRLAWRLEGTDLYVYANGSLRVEKSALRPIVEALCADTELRADEVIGAQPSSVPLLEWLRDEGALQVYV